MQLDEYRKLNGRDKRFVVGIDAGVSTDFAIFDRQTQKWCELKTIDFHSACAYIDSVLPKDYLIIIEKPKKNFAYPQHVIHSTSKISVVKFENVAPSTPGRTTAKPRF